MRADPEDGDPEAGAEEVQASANGGGGERGSGGGMAAKTKRAGEVARRQKGSGGRLVPVKPARHSTAACPSLLLASSSDLVPCVEKSWPKGHFLWPVLVISDGSHRRKLPGGEIAASSARELGERNR